MTGGAGAVTGARTASAAGLRLIAHHDLGGHGDGMQVIRHGDAVYVGHTGTTGAGHLGARRRRPGPAGAGHPVAGPAAQPHPQGAGRRRPAAGQPREVPLPRAGHRPGVGGAGHLPAGRTRCARTRLAFWPSGGRGVHRVVWTGGRYAHMSAIPDHFRDRIWVVVDLADPRTRWRRPAGGGPASGTTSSRAGPRGSGTPRITRSSRGTGPTSATTMRAWWCWTCPT